MRKLSKVFAVVMALCMGNTSIPLFLACTVMTLPAFKAARWASCARTLSPT